MGFELGPKLLRRAPKGWLAGRAFPLRHSVYSHPQGHEGGETVFETSAGLTVLWRVKVPGREPYELEEKRSAPMWLHANGIGSGNRWYKVRVRPSRWSTRMNDPALRRMLAEQSPWRTKPAGWEQDDADS
jgi:hypothetical protein